MRRRRPRSVRRSHPMCMRVVALKRRFRSVQWPSDSRAATRRSPSSSSYALARMLAHQASPTMPKPSITRRRSASSSTPAAGSTSAGQVIACVTMAGSACAGVGCVCGSHVASGSLSCIVSTGDVAVTIGFGLSGRKREIAISPVPMMKKKIPKMRNSPCGSWTASTLRFCGRRFEHVAQRRPYVA